MTAAKKGKKKGKRAKTRPPSPPARTTPSRRIWWLFLIGLTIATLTFFGSFITERNSVMFGTDMLSQAYQSRSFAVEQVQSGHGLPQWNPFVFGGLPYLSTLPYPVYYPSSLLYFAMPLHRAIGWGFVLHVILAGALMYGLARELKLAPGAALVAGVAYGFTGYLMSHLYAGQDGRMFAMSWTPALFLLAERAIERRRPHWFLWLTAVVALQAFTPHVQMMYFAAMGVAAYVAFRLVQLYRETDATRTVALLGASFVGAYALAGLLALIEIWPTANMLQFSHRADRGYEYASSWSMPVQETLATVWPGFQGYLREYWGTNPFKLHTEYLGAVPVLLALLALVVRRSARVWFFAALAIGGLLFAWGAATPVHRLFYWTLPIMKSFRAPAMMYSVVALSTCVLAGFGAQCLYDRWEALADRRHLAWKVAGGLGVVWFALWAWATTAPDGFANIWTSLLYDTQFSVRRTPDILQAMPAFVTGLGLFALFWGAGVVICWLAARRQMAPLIACAILASIALVDLWRVDRDFYDTLPIERVTRADPTVDFLQQQPAPFRVWPLPNAYGPNDLMLFGIESVTGSQNFRLAWWDDLVGEDLQGLAEPHVWSLLNVRYVVSGPAVQAAGFDLVHQDGGRHVYARQAVTPRAWVVHDAVPVDDAPDARARLLDPDFDPLHTAILTSKAERPALSSAEPGSSTVEWVTRDTDRLILDAQMAADGLLVTSEIYHPYWRATIDGEPTRVSQVDVALRAVAVPTGRHRIEMEFEDPFVTYGRWGSLGGLALWLGLLVATWRKRDLAS